MAVDGGETKIVSEIVVNNRYAGGESGGFVGEKLRAVVNGI